jgi:hypothetical protein
MVRSGGRATQAADCVEKRIYLTTGIAVLLAAAMGIICLFVAHSKWHEDWFPYFPDITRDLGIAFIVSSIIAVLLEFYRFVHHQFGAMREVFDVMMSEKITPDVWLEVKDLIESKKIIRKAVHIRVALSYIEGAPQHLCKLSVEYGYELHGFGKRSTKVKVAHELDYQFAGICENLPCFTNFTLDGENLGPNDATDLTDANRTGRILRDVWVSERDGPPVRVWVERHELVPVPGSYNLYIPDFMKDLTMVIAALPPDVRVEVWIRPQGTGEELREVGNTWHSSELMLPGQGIEVKFISTTKSTPLVAASASAAVKPADSLNV